MDCVLKNQRISIDGRSLARIFVKSEGKNKVISGRWGASIAYFCVAI